MGKYTPPLKYRNILMWIINYYKDSVTQIDILERILKDQHPEKYKQGAQILLSIQTGISHELTNLINLITDDKVKHHSTINEIIEHLITALLEQKNANAKSKKE